MKKILAAAMLAAMILMAGCGDKVEEAKKEAASEVQEAASKVEQKAAEVASNTPATAKTDSKISIGGIYPGMSFDEAKKILGESVTSDDDEFIFANGLKLDVEGGVVEEIKTTTSGIKTAQGVEVGMMEYAIDEFCGAADKVETDDDGEVEYKYYSGDKKSEVVYTVRNDLITEIKLGTSK